MIIVSQDKRTIVNFKRINYIEITKKDDNSYTIYLNFADSDWKNIGDYKTEERAEEVLKEVIRFYEVCNRYKYSYSTNLFFEKRFIYEMPKE